MKLNQNYTNPSNPVTQIPFALPASTSVLLEVYNLLGQRVAILLNDQQSAGYHTFRFDATQMPSGTYLYRLTAGAASETAKMLLMK